MKQVSTPSGNTNPTPSNVPPKSADVVDLCQWAFDHYQSGRLSVARQCELLEAAFAKRRADNLATWQELAKAIQAQEKSRDKR